MSSKYELIRNKALFRNSIMVNSSLNDSFQLLLQPIFN